MMSTNQAQLARPFVSVVIPTIGKPSQLAQVVAGLCQDDFNVPYEIIVVVDGAPASINGLDKRDPRCTSCSTAATGRQLGVARARNMGIAIARGEIVAFLDDDTIPCKGWMNRILRTLDAGGVKAVVGLVDSPPVRTAVDRLRELGYKRRNILNRRRPDVESPVYRQFGGRADLAGTHLVDYLSGGNCAVLRAALTSVGGFDERLLVGQDRELGRRLLVGGHPVAYEPCMRVLHFNEGTLRKLARGRFRSGYFNFVAGEHRNPWDIFQQFGVTWQGLWREHGLAVFVAALISNLAYSAGRWWARTQARRSALHSSASGKVSSAECPLPFVAVSPASPESQYRFLDVTRPTAQRHRSLAPPDQQ